MSPAGAAANPLANDLAHILAHTGEAWELLRGQNIFLTGGTGFFGRWLLESFAHANKSLDLKARIVVLSRNPGQFTSTAPHLGARSDISYVRGDVQTFTADGVRAQLGEDAPRRYEFVIHAATPASAKLNAEDPVLMLDTIVRGTRAALEFAVASGTRRFLLTSSGAVYGTQPSDLTHVPEDYLGGPDCAQAGAAYAEGKRLAELLCVCFHQQHAIEPLLARCFAFVGPFLPLETHFAIGNFIRDAQRGGPIFVSGDGTPFRSYLYAADLAIWLWTILAKGEPSRPYNVGSSRDLTIRELADTVASAFDGEIEVKVAVKPSATGRVSRYVPSTARASEELGLLERVALLDGIRRTVAFARP